jgi:hypothetical protein
VFGAFGLAFLYTQLRGRTMQVEVIRARAEAAALERLAESLLAVRDLANTPLQTIGASAAVLRKKHPELAGTLDRIDRALERLHELSRILERDETSVDWSRRHEAFDAHQRLGVRGAVDKPP